MEQWCCDSHDVDVLRELAERKAAIANDPLNLERRRLWYALDAGEAERPMVLAESWVAFEKLPASELRCSEEWARDVERGLRLELFQFDEIKDDHVVEPVFQCNWRVQCSDYGVEVKTDWAQRVSGNVSSRRWEAPIKDISRDFHQLRPRTFSVDREYTFAWKAHLEKVFDGILPVRIRGGFWWSAGLTGTAITLIGLENYMLYMCTDPEGLHRVMAFLRNDMLAYIDWLEKEELLSLNNENDYIGSGSMGYTRALPQPDWRTGDPVRTKDMWVLAESQESVGVSPQMLEEFVYPYYRSIVERFGRCYYGCCEPVHQCWHVIKNLPNLKRLSISPWCDEAFMAAQLGREYVFSRKCHPTRISTPQFDEGEIRNELRYTLEVAKGCNVELIMKDVHTLCGEPWRMGRWVEIAREEIERAA
jgi:hypothetical protein